MAKDYQCQVFSFDPTMEDPEYIRETGVHFFPIGLADHDHILDTYGQEHAFVYEIKNKNRNLTMMTIESIAKMLGHENVRINN